MERSVFTLANSLGELDTLCERLETFGEANGFSPKSIFETNLVLDELITNVISYGFPQGGNHSLNVELSLAGDLLTVVLTDDGTPFDPRQSPEPDTTASIEDRPIGGLGIHLVRRLVESIEYERADGRNVLRLTRRVQRTE